MRKFALATLFVLFFASVGAQRVGVVLSGGGAKGLYHIGILKALEENNIPIDYVSGTSMGAIVAGLYAAGYTPQEMEAIFTSDEIKYWLTGKIEDKYFYFFKKLPVNSAMITVDINQAKLFSPKTDNSATYSDANESIVAAPSSLIPSSQLDIGFLQYFAPMTAMARNNFDSLFVPFRCVSVDATVKKEYVWRGGDLGMAIRSSMAIPIVFSPIRKDSMIMFDGGIMNNFPWQVMDQDFAPDVIIGGKCVSGRTDLNTLPGQIEALLMNKTDYDLPEEKGLMIGRNLDDVGLLDFKKVAYTIQQGYQDALARMPEIKNRIARRMPSDELYRRRLKYRSDLPELIFDGYDIRGISKRQVNYVVRQMRTDYNKNDAGKAVLDFEEFKSEFNKVLSESTVTSGFPRAIYNDTTGYFKVNVRMHTRPGLKVQLGGNISSSSLNQGFLGLQYDRIGNNRSTYTLNGYVGAYYSSAQVGTRYTFNRKRPFYVDWYVTYNFFDYVRGNGLQLFFQNQSEGYSRLNEVFVNGDLAVPLGRSSIFKMGVSAGYDVYKYFQSNNFEKHDSPDRTKLPFFSALAQYEKNTLNYLMYPIRGMEQTVSGVFVTARERFTAGSTSSEELNGSEGHTWIGAKFMRQDYYRLSKHLSLGFHSEGLYSTMRPMFNDYTTRMLSPRFAPTPMSKILFLKEFHNPTYLAAGVMPTLEFSDKFYLKNEVYAYVSDLDYLSQISNNIRFMYASTLVYQTPIGPVSVGVSYFDVSNMKRWYAGFNVGYVLFNRRGIIY